MPLTVRGVDASRAVAAECIYLKITALARPARHHV
jgi:hypothetical protein